ncbi:MAG: c-type cytochrome [Rhodocyclales bacterium]|nr:c-type cytochrome [Rhodocyclales bacterium]
MNGRTWISKAPEGHASGHLVTLALLIGSAGAVAQGAPGTNPIANCIECHGTNGLGGEPDFPHLNGMPEHLLKNMMDAFRDGKRPLKVRLHREIPADDVAPIARHYAQQKAVRPKSPTQPGLVARGESLYQQRCADCHLDNGRDSDKEAPLTAGQSLPYLVAQTLAYKNGERKFPYLMDGAYRNLSDEDLTAIAHFFAAQDQLAPVQGRRRRR